MNDSAEVNSAAPKKEKPAPEPTATLSEFFQYISACEALLLAFAIVCATGTGVAQPLMLLAFGELFQGLGAGSVISGAVVSDDRMNTVLLILIYIGVGMFICQAIAVIIIDTITARQMLKYRRAYLKAVLRQDVAWYDVSNPEELSTQFAEAMVKIQKAFKAQAMLFVGIGYGGGGFILAFVPQLGNPEVAGVTLLSVPILICSAVAMMYLVEHGSKMITKAYGVAGGIATECLFSMRTIVSFGIEPAFEKRYNGALSSVHRTTIINKTLLMGSGGLILSSYLIMMATAVVYGAYRLSGEMEDSSFPLAVNGSVYSSGLPNGTDATTYYCADASGALAGVSIGAPCAPLAPFKMTCQLGGTIADASETPFLYFAAGVPLEQIPVQNYEATVLAGLGFDSVAAFTDFVKSHASASYLKDNPDYNPCFVAGDKIIIAIFAIMMMGEGFGMISQPAQTFSLGRSASAKVLAIIRRVPAIDSFSVEGLKLTGIEGRIEVSNVTFAYPTAPQKLVCKGYSLSVAAGTTVALCGPSGSGKSTLIQLLERFYDPLSGSITLDGVDVKALNVRWLRSQMGLVSQEPLLFQGTVAQNIAYGKPGVATQAEIEEAAKMANAHDFITSNLADKYETQVGQGGGKLSGGQKQRVAIARAIIKKPAVLLLDEATSALDTKSEKIVQAALDEIMTKQKRTTIVIAHRLSTIRNADKIAVVSEGRIVEEGTFDSLLKINEGVFQGLAQRQEALLALDKSSWQLVANDKKVDGASKEATVGVTEASGEATASNDFTDFELKSDAKKGAEEGDRKETKEEAAPIMRLVAMQRDMFLPMLLMVLFSGTACALSTWSFYVMVRVQKVLFLADVEKMREDAVSISFELAIYAASIIGCFLLSGFFNGLAGSALTAKLRVRGMKALLRQEMGWFDEEENSASELTAFLAEKVDKVKTITTEQLDLVAELVGSFGMFIAVLVIYSDWRILLAWLGMILVLCIIMPLQVAMVTGEDAAEGKKKKGKEDTSKLAQAATSANRIVGDATFGIRTVASFNLEQRFYDGFAASSQEVSLIQQRDAYVSGILQGFTQFVMMSSMGGVFYYSIWLANRGYVDFEAALAPLFAVMGILVPLLKAGALADLKSASNAAVRLFKIFDRQPLIDNLGEEGATPKRRVEGRIEVSNVTFAYPTAPQKLVCKGYSLSVAAGTTVALCGPSGSGKSTLIQLLERFYDPLSGSITLDGVDVKALNVRWLRSQMGLVSQEPLLFQGTVAQNIAYGKPGVATQAEIEEAAKMANAHDFITSNLANGYETDVGLRGGKLSGGQKQRVAIARAIIKKPAVLLLDEATSALDNESEKIVQAALDEIMTKQKRTTIVIAHRLSTIRTADKIAVVSEGRIVEEGTHEELLSLGGMYTSLALQG